MPTSANAPSSSTAVVARVNGVALTQADLSDQEQVIFPYFRMHNGRIPPSAEPEIRREALHRLVLDELLYQEARRRNLKVPEAQLQKGLRELRESFRSPEAYNAAVAKKYGSAAALESRIRRSLVVRELWSTEVTRKSVVTAAEVRAYYLKNKPRFVRPEAASIQSISIMFPKDATEQQKQQARKRAEELLPKARAARNYEEFGILAEQVSEDPWRVMMGDHKWKHRGEVDPEFEPIFSMKPGQTTGVLQSREGFHILRINDHQPQRQMKFEEISDRLRKELEAKRLEERAERFEQSLRKNAKIEM
ncbi:MAG TPA: peptidyl-prolyl cis-trans isomerase [Terriglobales bacterium]|nr:peptidyl-prolyl cis-trans isomerase [Terriglobales bacterium]